MKNHFLRALVWLFACCTIPAQTRNDTSFVDPAALASQVRQIERALNTESAAQIRADLPPRWRVQTPDGDYTISTTPLQSLLIRSSSDAGKHHIITDAQNWLDFLASQLDSYSSPANQATQTRTALQHILARAEFAGNAPPSAWERFWDRLSTRILNWLKHLFIFSLANSGGGEILFWLVLAAAVSLLFFILIRLWTNRYRYSLKLSGAPSPASLRTSQQWLHAARAASDAGDFRKAIQCAYWAGVSRLQESQALPQDTACTPREYLRLLSAKAAKQDAVAPLRTLTSHLERFWYARAAAAAEDFSPCLASLEALGCHLD